LSTSDTASDSGCRPCPQWSVKRAVDSDLPSSARRRGADRPQTGPAMTITIERLRWWHIDDLLPLEADLFGAEQWSAAMFWNELANGHHYVVALDDQALVGYGGLAVTGPGEAWVNNIAVRRDHQRQGIGRRLLEALLDQARAHEARSVPLEVAADN